MIAHTDRTAGWRRITAIFIAVVFVLALTLPALARSGGFRSGGGFKSGGFRSGGFSSSYRRSTPKFNFGGIRRSTPKTTAPRIFKGFSTKRSETGTKSNLPNTGSYSTKNRSLSNRSGSFSTPRTTKAADSLVSGFSSRDRKSYRTQTKSFSGGYPAGAKVAKDGTLLSIRGNTPSGKKIIVNKYPRRDISVYGRAPYEPIWYNNWYWGSPWWFHLFFRPQYHWWGLGPWGWGWWTPNPIGFILSAMVLGSVGFGLYSVWRKRTAA